MQLINSCISSAIYKRAPPTPSEIGKFQINKFWIRKKKNPNFINHLILSFRKLVATVTKFGVSIIKMVTIGENY